MNFSRSIRQLLAATALTLAAALPAQAANTAFSGAAVAGCSYANQTYTCASLPLPNYNDSISIASGYTVVVSSAVSFGYNQGLTMSGSAALQSSGDLNIGDINPSNLAVSGGSLTSGGTFSIGAQAQTITANISAATLNIGTGSATKITGSLTATGTVSLGSHVTIVGPVTGATVNTTSPVSLTGDVTASSAFTLASGSSLVGNVTAPTVTLSPSSVTVRGNIAASTSLSIGSGNAVNGNVSGGALTLSPSSASITGNVNLTGDVDIGSGDNITGNLVAHNVTTESSNGYISGNASVNHLTLNYGGYVGGTITCTAPGATGCSCVDYSNSGRPAPTSCGAATPPAGPDHILISQSGSGLTCQPSTVTLTACANASCTVPYTSGAAVTFSTQPSSGSAANQTVNISSSGSASVSVVQPTADTLTLSAASASAANSYVCANSSSNIAANACKLTFSDTGLLLTIQDANANPISSFASAVTPSPTLLISALKKGSNSAASCQPLFNGAQTVKFSCSYINPTSGTLPAIVGGTPLAANSSSACSSAGANVNLTFTSSGTASTTLNYNDVGQLTLNATYTGSGNYNGLKASGASSTFTVAPGSLLVTVPNNPSSSNPSSSDPVFTRAGQPFSASVTALNKANNWTPNYGKETSPESFVLTSSKLALTGSADGTTVLSTDENPALSPAAQTWLATPSGAYTTSNLAWNEVGSIVLTAALSNQAGYLGSGLAATGNTTVGRFIPDHFKTTVLPAANGVPMACAPGIGNCPTANQMVYSGQPFGVTVTALGAAGKTMLNYRGGLAKAVSFTGWANAGSSVSTDKNPPLKPSNNNAFSGTVAPTNFNAGVAAPATPLTVQYNFNSINPTSTAALAAPTIVYLRALDTDLTNMASATPSAGVGDSSSEPAVMVVSGALLVSNNYGSETSPMPVKLKAQYWNGTTAYVNSTTDNNTTGYALNTNGISFTNCTQHLATGGTAGVGQSNCIAAVKLKSPPASLTFSNGLSSFLLAAPGSGNTGSVDISINDSIAPFVIPFLPAITGRSVFGVYRSGPVIYLREVY